MKQLALFLFMFSSTLLWAQEHGIPTKYMNDPAVDLTRNGKLLMSDEVHELHTSSNGKFDISTLNPVETSDLWKNTFLKTLPNDISPVNDLDEVTFHSPMLSPSGIFRFNVISTNSDNKFYTMMLSKNVHSSLLTKSLLRKIGYQIPDIKRLGQVVINFKTENQKLGFISYLEKKAMAGAPANWIVEDLGTKLVLQDVVIMNSNTSVYNLAYGVTSDIIQGRRLMSALAVPLSIVNLSESVNMLRWSTGIVINKRVNLDLNNLADFQCTWDDARWITRRIEKLTREDWKEIVASSQIPKVVQQVLLEKLISRRNSAMKLFKIDAEEIAVDGLVNNGLELIDGKLTQQKWPGFGSRFAHGDPESPLSDSDIKSWVKSRAISTAMEVALSQINQLPYLGTDIKALSTQTFEKHMADAMTKSVLERKPVEVPLKTWVFPTFKGNLILSRNLVTGTYLGTDNLVQLVDTVGVSVGAGVYAGSMGLKSKKLIGEGLMPINASGGANASYMRTYAHLRPVINIKRSLKYPFKNILVPLVKKEFGDLLHTAYMTSIDPKAQHQERENAIAAALKPFKDLMNIGESILVTDSVIVSSGAQASAKIYGQLLTASLGLSAGNIVMSRFHVHRKSEDSFHVYRDLGQKASVSMGMSIDSLVPVLSISFKKSLGHAKVKYFNISLAKDNANVFDNAQALRSAILHSTTNELEEKKIVPYVIKHSFTESSPSANFFFWQFIHQKQSTNITVTNQKGEEKYLRRYLLGNTRGKNYQAYVNSVINHWVGLLFEKDAGLSDATGSNPGYSFKGQAKTKIVTLDQELDASGDVIEPFVSISHVRNGWSIERKKAEELLEEMRQRYKFQFFNAPILNDTSKIYLYNIGVTTMIYQKGLEHLLKLDDKQIKRIFLENQMRNSLVVNPNLAEEKADEDFNDDKYASTGVNKFLRLLRKYQRFDLNGKNARANKNFLKALSFMEKSLYLPGIVKLVGGEDNIYVSARISGFREGDEDGDRGITSNSFGAYGSRKVLGPVVQVQRTTDMLEGEFFINWMMQRLI